MIQAAIEHDRGLGGYQQVHLSNDGGPDRIWLENLQITSTPRDLHIVLIGGFVTCSSSEPEGRTTISGSPQQRPAL